MTRPARPALPLLAAVVLLLLLPPLPSQLPSPLPSPRTSRLAPGRHPTPAAMRPATVGAVRVAAGAHTGWSAPVPGPVTVVRAFAPGQQRWSPGHRGVDLAAAARGPVLAAGPGRVVFAGPVAGRGVVSVAHGDLRTTYEPVAATVRTGDVVAAGSPLGVLDPGHAGCGACLHWGLRRGDDYLDPMRLLRPVRVRLLPLTGSGP